MNLELISKYKIPILFGAVGVFLFILAVISSLYQPSGSKDLNGVMIIDEENSVAAEGQLIMADVQGAIGVPGLYEVSADTRVGEMIDLAGGLSDEADTEWIARQLNRAQVVKDGMKLYIPFEYDSALTGNSITDQSSSISQININTASASELETLSGIGEKRAQDIIANRPYGTIEELVEKNVITDTILSSIRENISVY